METKANQLNMCTERSLKSHVLFLDLSVANCSSPSMTPLRRSSKLGTDVCIEVTSIASSFNVLLISFSLADGPEMHSTSKHHSWPQCAGWRRLPLLNRDMTGKNFEFPLLSFLETVTTSATSKISTWLTAFRKADSHLITISEDSTHSPFNDIPAFVAQIA